MSYITKPSIMYWSIAAHLLLVLTMFSVQVVTADYQLEVRLVSYSNPDHRLRGGGRCDRDSNCDNVFSFEINVGDGWEQPQETGIYWNNDNIIFVHTLRGGRANPLVFTGVRWSNIRLHVMVCDRDNDRCEDVSVDEVRTIELRQETTLLTVISSSGGYSRTLQLSYQVICLLDYYGPECSAYCVPTDDSIGHFTCDETDGSKICLPDYYGPECSDYCVPRDDSIGHYTCDESDGSKICLPDYYGPECSVYCVPRDDSIGNYTCESDGTKICLPDYYGPECPAYCVPRDDSIGNYTCHETDGTKICSLDFGGVNCKMAQAEDKYSESTSSTEATIIGGTVAGVTVLIIALLIMATAVWVARKKYKGQAGSSDAEHELEENPSYGDVAKNRSYRVVTKSAHQHVPTMECNGLRGNTVNSGDGKHQICCDQNPSYMSHDATMHTYERVNPPSNDGSSAIGMDTNTDYDYVL